MTKRALLLLGLLLVVSEAHAQSVSVGTKTSTTQDSSIRVSPIGTKVFYDAFESAFDTTNIWAAPTSAAGGVGESWSAGQITLGTGTTANGYAYVQTQASFQPVPPGFNIFQQSIKVPAAIPANTEAYWGFGTSPATPTAAIPITEGCGFEIQTGGKMFAVCFAGSVRTNIQDLSAATGNGTQPTDGQVHAYYVYFRGDFYWFAIDNVQNVVASQTSGVNGPNVNTQPIKIAANAGTSNPLSSLTITVLSAWVGDMTGGGPQIADGTFPWRRALVTAVGGIGTHPIASSAPGIGITPVVGGSAVSSLVLKNAPGNLYSVYAECSAACWLMVFNATAAPSNSSTTAGVASGNMVECIPIAAGGSGSINYASGPPAVYTVGITAAISSTTCATLTLATTGFIHGMVQ